MGSGSEEQENTLAASKAEIEAGEQELEKGQKQLKAAKKKLNKAQKEIDSNAETLAAGGWNWMPMWQTSSVSRTPSTVNALL